MEAILNKEGGGGESGIFNGKIQFNTDYNNSSPRKVFYILIHIINGKRK